VRGERSAALVHAIRSLQSRVSGVLAAGLMIALGFSALSWYYAHALTRSSHARAAAQTTAATHAQGEMALPALGPITPPSSVHVPATAKEVAETAPAALSEVPLTAAPAIPSSSYKSYTSAYTGAAGGLPGAYSSPGVEPAKTPAELVRERRLAGGVFVHESQVPTTSARAQQENIAAAPAVVGTPVEAAADISRTGERDAAALSAWLRPDVTAAAQAHLLPTARFLLPKGAFIDCTLETAIDSTLPGMTTCITAGDTFSADGKVVLIERGSKLVGETRGQVQQGQARVFVVWTQVRTPTGVIVPLDSPGTDELGRAGLPGEVQRHFWERFGAAMLISIVNGAIQAGVQAANHSGGAILYAPSTSQDVLTEALKDTTHIPPTIVKRNGDRIQVLVAPDVDFRPVYELRTSAAGR